MDGDSGAVVISGGSSGLGTGGDISVTVGSVEPMVVQWNLLQA
jgi:hypothetical protein